MISIIVPVYNAEKYIERCIKSIMSQTYSEWELIIINDGSSDKSRALQASRAATCAAGAIIAAWHRYITITGT